MYDPLHNAITIASQIPQSGRSNVNGVVVKNALSAQKVKPFTVQQRRDDLLAIISRSSYKTPG